ncbi:MAG: glycine cleavage system aminomethyltransferase GcvT, partial [Candidatus Poribacteria bacterium]|nr:glycine cleavage system aminomethyltransferase GcvT [Candidatus Poribacteria bacterium]
MAETPVADLKRTPLAVTHESLGAKMIEFGGWYMPVQYSGIIEEHHAVRQRVGVFDLSHMGEIVVSGGGALAYLQRLVTNDVGKLSNGEALYTPMCHPTGGIVDDLIVYRVAADSYLLVVNASNIDKDFGWMRENASGDVTIDNRSDETALVAVQGPRSLDVLQKLTDAPVSDLPFMSFLDQATVGGACVTLTRTGYTGELGYEL